MDKQGYNSRRDESRGMAKADVRMNNERYMPKGMDLKDGAQASAPRKINVPCGEGFSQVKPFKAGNLGYPKQAFGYKY